MKSGNSGSAWRWGPAETESAQQADQRARHSVTFCRQSRDVVAPGPKLIFLGVGLRDLIAGWCCLAHLRIPRFAFCFWSCVAPGLC